MKKILRLLIVMILMAFLPACANNTSTPIKPNEKNMIINVKNNANFEFYGLEAGVLNHSQGSINADESKIEKGEVISFEFLEEDFELEGKAEMEVFILADSNIEDDGDRIPINNKVTLELANNKELFFEVTGDSIMEADLKKLK